MAGKIRVAAIQTGLWKKDEERAILDAEALVGDAAKRGAKLLCLPEHWLLSKIVEPENEIYEKFADLAAKLNVYINLGGIYEREESDVHFVSLTISSDGTILSKQKKVHLYRGEKRRAIPGERFEIFRVDEVNVGVLVCHDIVFPESARTVVLKGAELLIVPSLIISKGIEPWHVYVMARALENRVPVISPNVYSLPLFPGKSIIVDLDYNRKESVMELRPFVASGGRGIIDAEINLDEKRPFREERLSERRPDVYINNK
jgi:predicted amidohydrolase